MSAHSTLGASSMYRWSACPGSVRLSAGMPNTSSAYAQEGTDAHEKAADLLKGVPLPGCDPEMREAIDVYVNAVKDHCVPGATLLVEHRFDLSAVFPGCFGTCDAVVYNPHNRVLYVFDYKHGAGIPVEVKANPQLRYYALGALVTLPDFKPRKAVMVIVQPRCNHPDGPIREDEIDALDLLDFRADLVAYAKETERADAPLNPGDHCRFCPGAAVCPALHAKAQTVAKLEFSPATAYDPAALRTALDSREVVKAWLKALDEFAYHEAEAGRCPPGYKLVAKRATRKHKNEADSVEYLQDAGFAPSQIYERSLKSPAQIEALFPEKGVPEGLAVLFESVSSGHTLVPNSDKRPAVKPNAADEFTAVPKSNATPLALFN